MKFDQLINEIMEYESDTFFAKGCNLKRKEAEKMGEMLIDKIVNRMDGITLDYCLSQVRGK